MPRRCLDCNGWCKKGSTFLCFNMISCQLYIDMTGCWEIRTCRILCTKGLKWIFYDSYISFSPFSNLTCVKIIKDMVGLLIFYL